MSKTNVEIDFFQLEKRKAAAPPTLFSLQGAASAGPKGGIQSVVSRINPQLLRTVMAAGAAGSSDHVGLRPTGELSPSPRPSSPTANVDAKRTSPPPLPVFNPASRWCCSGRGCSAVAETAPLTIFYNGTVTVLDVSSDKAEAIIRMAESSAGIVGSLAGSPEASLVDIDRVEGGELWDLPIARRKSLHRFLQKRKDSRLASASSPYYAVTTSHPC